MMGVVEYALLSVSEVQFQMFSHLGSLFKFYMRAS